MGSTLRFILYCSAFLVLVCLYQSADAGWAKGRIYIDMANCYKNLPRKNEAETSAEITKNQKKCLKLNSDPQSICYKLCMLWVGKLVGKEKVGRGKTAFMAISEDAWTQSAIQYMGIAKEDLNGNGGGNKDLVTKKLEKCNKDHSKYMTESFFFVLSLPEKKTNLARIFHRKPKPNGASSLAVLKKRLIVKDLTYKLEESKLQKYDLIWNLK
ncbi:hypothetical protein Ocin01_16666 [Orchesella cincta]|uniref:Uncharacterized protein n=1 Tax=Orchesella cincta TaxID=48709 RepID=A0A1D2MAJ9_ORCCI|nr:hypothetical protein Ocin01_16666 [Orchesella cincta]